MSASSSADPTSELRRNRLTIWDALAQSFGFLGPVMVVSFLTSLVATGAGAATPLAILLGGIACLAVAYIVSQYATKLAAAGSIYNYVTKSLGPGWGFIGGWMYFVATLFLTFGIIGGVGGWVSMLIADQLGIQIPFVLFSIVEVVLLFLLTFYDIRISTRTQLTLVFLSVLLVLGFAISIIIRGGAAGNTLEPFLPTTAPGVWSGLAFGMIFGILAFTGFESAASLGEETSNPRKNIPPAIMGCVIGGIIFYAIVSYAMAIGFGVANGEKWAQDPTAMYTLAGMYGANWLVVLITVAAIIDGFAVSLGCLNACARVTFAMGRDGALPRFLGRSHPVYQTPYIANISILVLAIVAALVFYVLQGAEAWSALFGFFAGMGGLSIEVLYGIVGISAVVFFPKLYRSQFNVFKHVIVPIIAILAVLAAIYGSVQPVPDPLLSLVPYLVLIGLVLGLVVAGYLQATRPGIVQQIGRRLVEDEVGSF